MSYGYYPPPGSSWPGYGAPPAQQARSTYGALPPGVIPVTMPNGMVSFHHVPPPMQPPFAPQNVYGGPADGIPGQYSAVRAHQQGNPGPPPWQAPPLNTHPHPPAHHPPPRPHQESRHYTRNSLSGSASSQPGIHNLGHAPSPRPPFPSRASTSKAVTQTPNAKHRPPLPRPTSDIVPEPSSSRPRAKSNATATAPSTPSAGSSRTPAPLRLDPSPAYPHSAASTPVPSRSTPYTPLGSATISAPLVDSKAGWGAAAPLPSEDYFAEPEVDVPAPTLATSRLLRWRMALARLGDDRSLAMRGWTVNWTRYWIKPEPPAVDELGREVIDLEPDPAEVKRKAEARDARLAAVVRHMDGMTSKDAQTRSLTDPCEFLWTITKEWRDLSQAPDFAKGRAKGKDRAISPSGLVEGPDDVLWVLEVPPARSEAATRAVTRSSRDDSEDVDSLWEGDDDEGDPRETSEQPNGAPSRGMLLSDLAVDGCQPLGAGTLSYAHLFPGYAEDDADQVGPPTALATALGSPATVLSGEDVFEPTAASGSAAESGRSERRTAMAAYAALMDACRRTCTFRLLEQGRQSPSGSRSGRFIRWQNDKLLYVARSDDLSRPYPTALEIDLDCWCSPTSAVCESRSRPSLLATLPNVDAEPGSKLRLAPYALSATYVRRWTQVDPAVSEQSPEAERLARKRATAESKAVASLRAIWLREVDDPGFDDEGHSWIVCHLQGPGGRVEVVWPGARCLLDLQPPTQAATAPDLADSEGLLSGQQLEQAIGLQGDILESIETLAADVADLTTAFAHGNRRGAHSDVSSSAAATPLYGVAEKSDTLGVTPSSLGTKPSPASMDAVGAAQTPAEAESGADRLEDPASSFWNDDFGIVNPSPRPVGSANGWNRSTFEAGNGVDDFDMDDLDVDAEFSFFDNPGETPPVLPASASMAAPATAPSPRDLSPFNDVSPQFGNSGSGYTASPSSLNTALFENPTPGSFNSYTPGRPGYTPDTGGAAPTPASAPAASQSTPPDAVLPPDALVSLHRSPTIPATAFGSLSLAPASPRPSRMQPRGFEEVSFRPTWTCPDDHYASRGGKYALPVPETALEHDEDSIAIVPAKRSFYNRLADPRAQVLKADQSKKARANVGLPRRPEWRIEDPSDYSDDNSDGSDSDIMLTDDDAYDSEAEADDAFVASAASSALGNVIKSCVGVSASTTSVESEGQAEAPSKFLKYWVNRLGCDNPTIDQELADPATGVCAPPADIAFPLLGALTHDLASEALLEDAVHLVPQPLVVVRSGQDEVALPADSLRYWPKLGISPGSGPKELYVSVTLHGGEDLPAVRSVAGTWMTELVASYKVCRFGSLTSLGVYTDAEATVAAHIRHTEGRGDHVLFSVVDTAQDREKAMAAGSPGLVHFRYIFITSKELLRVGSGDLFRRACQTYDAARRRVEMFVPPAVAPDPAEEPPVVSPRYEDTFAYRIHDNATQPRFLLQWPASSLDVLERYRIYHFAYQVVANGKYVVVTATDELGRLQLAKLLPDTDAVGTQSIAGHVWGFIERILKPLNAELRIVITHLGCMTIEQRFDWLDLLRSKLEERPSPLHVTLSKAEVQSSPPIFKIQDAPVGAHAPSDTDLEMGEVDPGSAIPSRVSTETIAVAVRHESHARPLHTSLNKLHVSLPLCTSYMYASTTGGASSPTSTLTFSLLDTIATPSCSFAETLYQHRDDILRSLADLAYLAALRAGPSVSLPLHLARLVDLGSIAQHHLCRPLNM